MNYQANEDTVRKFFAEVGTVTTVRMSKGDDGRSKGFCHVEFDTPEMAREALKLNGHEMEGRKVKLDVASNSGNKNHAKADKPKSDY